MSRYILHERETDAVPPSRGDGTPVTTERALFSPGDPANHAAKAEVAPHQRVTPGVGVRA